MGLAGCPSAVSSPPPTSSSTEKGGYRSLPIRGGVIMHSPTVGVSYRWWPCQVWIEGGRKSTCPPPLPAYLQNTQLSSGTTGSGRSALWKGGRTVFRQFVVSVSRWCSAHAGGPPASPRWSQTLNSIDNSTQFAKY